MPCSKFRPARMLRPSPSSMPPSQRIIGVAMIVMFLAIYLPVIHGEEKFLRGRFPQFNDYANQVPRLLPRLTPASHGDGAFSWDLYRKHREYNALLGASAIMGVLVAKSLWMSR